MPFDLSPEALTAAETFFRLLPAATRLKGNDYFQRGAVLSIAKEDDGYLAEVQGSRRYETRLIFAKGEWFGACSCPIFEDCKHACAALRELVSRVDKPAAQSTPARKKTPAAAKSAKPKTFRELVEEKLARPLTTREAEVARAVQALFRNHRLSEQVPEYHVAPLLGRGFSSSWSWEMLQLWPQPPRDVWEAWLYLAHFMSGRHKRWPEFLAGITAPEDVAALVGEWQRQRAVAAWSERLAMAAEETESEPPPAPALRVVFAPRAARLESRERPESEWAVVKKAQFDTFQAAALLGQFRLADDESALVWAAFRKGSTDTCTLAYDAPAAAPALNELLRNPLLARAVLTAAHAPFHRAPVPLAWRIDAPASEAGDYRLALALPDGAPPPELLVAVEGAPALFVTADTIYEAPRLAGLNADPDEPNLIPAPALETIGGITLLDRLGLPTPPRLADRVERRRARLVVEAALGHARHLGKDECLFVKLRAEWEGNAPAEHYAAEGWIFSPTPGSAPHADEAGKIIRLDRSPLHAAPSLVASLRGLGWQFHEQAWSRRLGKTFPAEFSEWLLALPAHAELRLDPALASLREAPLTARVRLDIEPAGVDWFDLTVALDLPDLELTPEEKRALLDARGGWVRLGAKGWRRLALQFSDDEDRSLAELGLSASDLASSEKQRLHTLQLAHESAARLLPAERAEEVRRRATELRTRVAPPLPAAITAELRPYQLEGFHFLAYLSANRFGGVLADDMGLGKTLQTLTWLAWLRDNDEGRRVNDEHPPLRPSSSGLRHSAPSLVVCPKSVMDNWRVEAERFMPGLRVHLWQAGAKGGVLEALKKCDLLVLNYAQLRVLRDPLTRVAWQAVILDEAQSIKNPDSQTAKAAGALEGAHRLALSGTPIENRLLDLWSIMAFAMPGVLGNRTRFGKLYDAKEDPLARRRLAARVRPFLLRRTKEQVARDLPARVEEELHCEMEGKQATLYRAELKRARQHLLQLHTPRELDQARFHILTSLLRLRQICCHPVLVDATAADAPSAKLEALMDLLEPLVEQGRKVLVFSQFVTVIELLHKAIDARGWRTFVLTGSTEDRGGLVADFQKTEGGAVFLLSLKAGGFGLNLTAASYVVLFDPWWNPAVENQAIDRTHRIGQTSTVFAYRLLVKGTIEEKIRALQKQKRAMADDILGEEAFARGLTLDDLRFLFAET